MDDAEHVRRVADRYSSNAEAYEELWAPELLPLGTRMIGMLPVERAERVLDLGAGVGVLVPVLRERFPGATVIAGDRAEGMIRRARGSRLVLDAMRPPFAGAAFDVVVMAFMLFHLPEPLDALRGVRKLVRSGGAIAVGTWGDSRPRRGVEEWAEELDARGAGAFEPETDHGRTDTAAKVAALLEASGFRDPRTELVRSEHPVTHDEFVQLRTRIGPSAYRLQTLPEAERAPFVEAATARIRALDERELVDDVDALLTVARG